MAAILPVFIFVYILSATISSINTSEALKKQAAEQAQLLSRTYSNHLDATINQYLSTVENLSSAVFTAVHIETILKEYKKRYPQFSHIMYTQNNGVIRDLAPYNPEWIGESIQDLPAWQNSFTQKKALISYTPDFWGEQTVTFTAPLLLHNILNDSPSVEGMVVMVLPLDILFQTISSVQIGESGSLFVLDNKGKFLYFKDPALTRTKGLEALSAKEPLIELSDSMINQKTGFATFSDEESRKYIAFSPVKSNLWSLGVYGSYYEITQEVRKSSSKNLFILIAGIILGSIISYFVVHSVVLPIEILTDMTRRIEKGERSISTIIENSSEVGILSHSINSMLLELNKNRDKLEDTVEQRTMELTRANEELGETVEELNTTNMALKHARNNLEDIVSERTSELSKAHNYIDNIINSMPSILIGVDFEGRVTQWNISASQFTGIEKRDAIGKELLSVFPLLINDISEITDALHSKTKLKHSKRPREVQNHTYYDDITVYPLITNGVEGAVIRIDDVTESVIMEESLKQSQKLDAIGQLAGGVAHDFNNMLAGILGSSELLKMSFHDEDRGQKYLGMIIESAKTAADLTSKLLLFSRKGSKESVVFNLNAAIEGAIDLLVHSLDKKTHIHQSFNAESAVIKGDFVQIQNAYLNLGINAGHAMPEGGDLYFSSENVNLDEEDCRISSFDIQPGSYIKTVVRDTGSGIDQNHLERIFEPFFTTKEMGSGTGLGLSVVYGAVQNHGGALSVESKIAEGTAFTMYFPLSKKETLNTITEPELIQGDACILVIDDDSTIREICRLLLENLGYSVITAVDGKNGLDIFLKNKDTIDLVLMDMVMPNMNGKECMAELKKIKSDVKVILISGYTNVEQHEIDAMGYVDFLSKPFEKSVLSIKVAKALTV